MLDNLRGIVTPRAIQVFLFGGVLAAAIIGGFSLLSSDDSPGSKASDVASASGTPRPTTTVAAGRTPSLSPQATAAGARPVPTSAPATYTVKAGDSASLVAKGLGVPDQDLAAWLKELASLNNIDPDRLEAGQVLKLPGGSTTAAAGSTAQPGSPGSSAQGTPGSTSSTPRPNSTANPPGSTSAAGSTSTPVPNATTPPGAPTNTPAASTNQPAATSTVAAPTSTPTPGPPPSIAVSPSRVTEGTVMTMTLSNFPPSSTVTVCFVVPDAGFQDCGNVDVDANGYFSEPGDPLPADIREFPGTYRMDASGANGSFASASFEVY